MSFNIETPAYKCFITQQHNTLVLFCITQKSTVHCSCNNFPLPLDPGFNFDLLYYTFIIAY